MSSPEISIVIPVYNEASIVQAATDDLCAAHLSANRTIDAGFCLSKFRSATDGFSGTFAVEALGVRN